MMGRIRGLIKRENITTIEDLLALQPGEGYMYGQAIYLFVHQQAERDLDEFMRQLSLQHGSSVEPDPSPLERVMCPTCQGHGVIWRRPRQEI